jgi:DNA-binding NtrC family response regulator
VGPEHLALPPDATASLQRTNLSFEGEPTLEELRRTYLEALLSKYDGRRARVAEVLGISERNLYRLLRKNVDA